MITYAAIDRDRAPTASFILTAFMFVFTFAACAFVTYLVEDWYASPDLFESVPDPVPFFGRYVTAAYAGWCFIYSIRIWNFMATPGAIPAYVGIPYLAIVALPQTAGIWLAAYSLWRLPTAQHEGAEAMMMIGPALYVLSLIVGQVLQSILEKVADILEPGF